MIISRIRIVSVFAFVYEVIKIVRIFCNSFSVTRVVFVETDCSFQIDLNTTKKIVIRLSEFHLPDHGIRLAFFPSQEIPFCFRTVSRTVFFLINIAGTDGTFHLKEIEFRYFSEKRSNVFIGYVNYMKRGESVCVCACSNSFLKVCF